MASSSSARDSLLKAVKFPQRIFRAYLAEDYDGKSQYVLVKLTHGGVASALKSRVAAGDHSGHEPMPEGTVVVVTSVHGTLEVLMGQRGARFGVGFAQMIISAHVGNSISGNGIHTLHWRGAYSGMTVNTPVVVQDTHGFTGVPGDMQWAGPTDLVTWHIPDGLGGKYLMGWEQAIFANNTAWWPTTPPFPPGPNPQPVKYIPSHASDGFGSEIAGGGATVEWRVMVNGSMVYNSFWVNSTPGTTFQQPQFQAEDIPITVAAGDEMQIDTNWTGTHFFDAIGDSYGNFAFGTQQGFFWLYRLPDDQQDA